MNANPYSRFLPDPWRAQAESTAPQPSWWTWPDGHARESGAVVVHVARAANPAATVRVLLVHGAGGHSGLLWPLASVLAAQGYDVLAPDLPLYGRTEVRRPRRVRYVDWVDLLADLVRAETATDPRPLVLFGASMGGMLSYEVAHRTGRVAAVVATCLLDFTDPDAVRHAVRTPALASLTPALRRLPTRLGGVRIPVTWFAPIDRMSSDAALSRACAADPRGAGARIPLRLLADLIAHRPPAPESYRGPRVLLAHPGADTWTPPELSLRFARRIAGRVDTVLLTNCGHFPIERPGLDELEAHARALAKDVAAGPS